MLYFIKSLQVLNKRTGEQRALYREDTDDGNG